MSRGERRPSQKQDSAPTRLDDAVETPEEALDHAAEQLRQALEADLLDRVRAAPSTFLERVVVDLLIAMGYGGGNAARGWVTGQAGDGGIDGTIWEDALGLDEVYLQAKKYAPGTTVGEGDLRNFAGAIDAANTTKGVFVTTAGFTRARDGLCGQESEAHRPDRRGETRAAHGRPRDRCAHPDPVCGQTDRRGLFRRGRPVRRSSWRFSCRRSDSGSTTFPPRRTSGDNAARESDAEIGFMARLLELCRLPRTNPGNQKEYVRRNGQ